MQGEQDFFAQIIANTAARLSARMHFKHGTGRGSARWCDKRHRLAAGQSIVFMP
jgi:hypothetical protein